MSEPKRLEDTKKARPLNQHDQSSRMNPQKMKQHEQVLQWVSQGPQCVYCDFRFNFVEFLSIGSLILIPSLGLCFFC